MSTIDQTLPARRAGSADRVDVNRILTEAFLDDPVFEWIFPDPAHRAEVLAPTFDAFADALARHDDTHLLEPPGVVPAVPMVAPPTGQTCVREKGGQSCKDWGV